MAIARLGGHRTRLTAPLRNFPLTLRKFCARRKRAQNVCTVRTAASVPHLVERDLFALYGDGEAGGADLLGGVALGIERGVGVVEVDEPHFGALAGRQLAEPLE